MSNQSGKIPINAVRNHKSSLAKYSNYTKQLYKSIDLIDNNRSRSSKRPVKIRGIKYRFQLSDLNKYADTTKYGNFDWKVKYQSLGRKVPKKQRKRALVREIHFDTLLRLLQKTDWAKTPIYEMFIEEQRWRHTDDSIYSEIELKYLHSSLQKMQNLPSQEEFNITEG